MLYLLSQTLISDPEKPIFAPYVGLPWKVAGA